MREVNILTFINGDIHWKMSLLRKEAPYSRETVRSSGTGGIFCNRRGLRVKRRYHCFFFGGSLLSTSLDAESAVLVRCCFSPSPPRAAMLGSWATRIVKLQFLSSREKRQENKVKVSDENESRPQGAELSAIRMPTCRAD